MQTHTHPISGVLNRGVRLVEGAQLRSDDMFDCSSGKWEEGNIEGIVLGSTTHIWIRPSGLSVDAEDLLSLLNLYGGSLFNSVAMSGGVHFIVPSLNYNWDTRIEVRAVRKPQCLQELVDCGYLATPERGKFTLTDLGKIEGQKILLS